MAAVKSKGKKVELAEAVSVVDDAEVIEVVKIVKKLYVLKVG